MHMFLTALRFFTLMTLVTGVLYPLLMALVGRSLFFHQTSGSLILQGDTVIGSEWVAQKTISHRYFWPRPSAVDYNPLPSGGSNLAPTSEVLRDTVTQRIMNLQSTHGGKTVPQELLFASASGLDPHITPEAAYYQMDRVAKARGLSLEQIQALVDEHTEGFQFGVLGQRRVNVLNLNHRLDVLERNAREH